MSRSTALPPALPFAPSWLHDEWLAAVGSAVGRVDTVEEQLIDYRQHGSNEISRKLSSRLMKFGSVRQSSCVRAKKSRSMVKFSVGRQL